MVVTAILLATGWALTIVSSRVPLWPPQQIPLFVPKAVAWLKGMKFPVLVRVTVVAIVLCLAPVLLRQVPQFL